MRKYLFLLFALFSFGAFAQSPKREFRSVWFQTVYGASSADWPSTTITSTGNVTQIAAQKKQMTDKLDMLKAANMNAISFQARSRSDAMYVSSYEPWSSDLVSRRGMDPGYDPLAFVVEECHKRGMECHVWINPYRYESNADLGNWGDNDVYRKDHLDWILTVPQIRSDGTSYNATILDPGNPEVRQRIVDIIREIITNYDVDGVMFDDYFYLQGIYNQDQAMQNAHKPSGQSVDDWRRENVNKMVADVYEMIQETKPYVRFGIGPAGVWGGNAESESKYDVQNPVGITSGYAFSGIYCDPLAWLSEGTIDYISPQIYWATAANGASNTDYNVLCPWWSDVANKFRRHMYTSQSATRIVDASYAKKWLYDTEVKIQVERNRSSNHDNAPGSVYFNTKSFLGKNPNESITIPEYFAKNVFINPALPPAINWKEYNEKASPENIQIKGTTLSWTCTDNCRRYSVYAIPNEYASQTGNFGTSKYLLGIAYGKDFDLADYSDKIATHKFGVAPLDDYANEFAPGMMEYTVKPNQATALISPENGGATTNPCALAWCSVNGVEYYVLEISEEEDFSSIFYRRDITETHFLTSDIPLKDKNTYYWRVRTRKIGVKDMVSEVRSFVVENLEITSPANNAVDMSLTPTITWINAGEGFKYTLQLASNSGFTTNLKEFTDIDAPSFTIPLGSVYTYSTYYVRVRAINNDAVTDWSIPVKFSTIQVAPEIPEIIAPTENSTVGAPLIVKWKEEPKAKEFYLQMSPQDNFAATNDRISLYIPGFEYQREINTDNLTVNTTYYLRIRAQYGDSSKTGWSPVVSFIYLGGTGMDNDQENSYELNCPTKLSADYVYINYKLPQMQSVKLYICDSTGKVVMNLYSGVADVGENQAVLEAYQLNAGLYILVMETQNGHYTRKLIK